MFDATFSVAHYYTYLDVPAVQLFVQPNFPIQSFPNGFTAEAHETAPLVGVSGASGTFALPSLYSVVRSEFAYFKDAPRYTQKGIDPFIFHPARGPTTGGRDLGDSFAYAAGLDINRFVRFINPNQTLLISTQFFFNHLFDAVDRKPIFGRPGIDQGEVLPVPARYVVARGLAGFPPTEPVYVKQPTNTFLNTLFIGTSYRSGTVAPGFTFLYDWGGAFLYQPSVKLSYDPFRFYVDLSIIDAHTLKGGSGISLYKDRDNIQFRFEYSL